MSQIPSKVSEIVGLKKWDKRFVELARFVSEWSKDPDAKVGAVITNEDGAIALGYNGFPKGIDDNVRLKTLKKQSIIIHAEENALMQAGGRAKGTTLYVWGKPVCINCAREIIQMRVSKVVSTNPREEDKNSKWYGKGVDAIDLFEEAGIKLVYYKIENTETKKPE